MSVILSNKSDDEIRWMLEDYGIKHGPVVGKYICGQAKACTLIDIAPNLFKSIKYTVD